MDTRPLPRIPAKLVVLCAVLLARGWTMAQPGTAYLFIEPNVSFTYDSSAFRIGEHFSNTAYGTRKYEVFHRGEPGPARLHIGALRAGPAPTQAAQDSAVAAAIAVANAINDGQAVAHLPRIAVRYKGFTGAGMVVRSPQVRNYGISFRCTAYFEGGACTLMYSRESPEAIDGYAADLRVVEQVIDGIRTHAAADLARRDSVVQHTARVNVRTVARPAELPAYVKAAYHGSVSVIGIPHLQVKEARVGSDGDAQVFLPDAAGKVPIHCSDSRKGVVGKRCDLIVLDDLGREVALPFTITFENP
jgi:hypothetical protein